MKKKIMITLAVFAVLGVGLYLYMYRSHRDISSENADYSLTVAQLHEQFTKNSNAAGKQYADKTVEVLGKVTAMDRAAHVVTIDEQLSATFTDSLLNGISLQKPIKIKGRFVGYDDLLEEFKVDQAALSE